MDTAVDGRGVRRGACTVCDCSQYEQGKENSNKCGYCECPCINHAKTPPSSSSSSSSSASQKRGADDEKERRRAKKRARKEKKDAAKKAELEVTREEQELLARLSYVPPVAINVAPPTGDLSRKLEALDGPSVLTVQDRQ